MKAQAQWNLLVRIWRNDLRYQSQAGFLGYVRRTPLKQGIRGGRQAIMKRAAAVLVAAAASVHAIGVAHWTR